MSKARSGVVRCSIAAPVSSAWTLAPLARPAGVTEAGTRAMPRRSSNAVADAANTAAATWVTLNRSVMTKSWSPHALRSAELGMQVRPAVPGVPSAAVGKGGELAGKNGRTAPGPADPATAGLLGIPPASAWTRRRARTTARHPGPLPGAAMLV
jgi:hypothetical protein